MNPFARCAPHAHQPWRQGWKGAVHRFQHTLKWRLVTLFLALAVAVTITFIIGVHHLVKAGWQGYGKPLLSDYVNHLAAEIGTPPSVDKARALTERLPITVRIEGPRVRWDSHPDRWRYWQRPGRMVSGTEGSWVHVRKLPDGHVLTFGLAEPVPTDAMGPHYAGWATLALLLLCTLGAYAYVRHLFRPLDDIHEGAVRFGKGDFAYRIPLRCHDELGDLTVQINTMAGEIQRMLEAKRGLLLAISHELRSPLTRARVNAELIDDSEAKAALLRDLAEMRDLISDLLETQRLTNGHAALQREPTDLNALVLETLKAQFAGRDIGTELAEGLARPPLDRTRIRLLLRNLLENALRHSADAAQPPVVCTVPDGDAVLLRVRDFGSGVAPEHLPHLTDAFYRADTARQRATGGVGLGLYLCRLVVNAHGGTLTIRNAEPGLAVEVRLPAVG
ncbi:MAG: ATP-binding protein [Pseudomonadota bacterium]